MLAILNTLSTLAELASTARHCLSLITNTMAGIASSVRCPCVLARGRNLPAGRAAGGAKRLRLPAAAADWLFYPKNKIRSFNTKHYKKQQQRGGEGTLRYCEGMGRDLPAGRAAGGAERLWLSAAAAYALFFPTNKVHSFST